MATEASREFDWVTARTNCSIDRVFLDLRQEVQQDVTTRNGLVSTSQKQDLIAFTFEPKEQQPNAFAVVRNGANVMSLVNFKRDNSAILAIDVNGKVIVEAKLTLNDFGDCRLVVGKDELTHWQFRRRGLQALFFDF